MASALNGSLMVSRQSVKEVLLDEGARSLGPQVLLFNIYHGYVPSTLFFQDLGVLVLFKVHEGK